MQVTLSEAGDFTPNAAVTTFYLNDIGVESNPDALAQDTAVLFQSFGPNLAAPINFIEVGAYEIPDLLGAPTGPPKGKGLASFSTAVAGGPREVACCLSYYADRNEPRRRGRMYFGPLAASAMAERPSTALANAILAIGSGINDLGGLDVNWVQYSPTDNASRTVTNMYVDNAWDTQRSRGSVATGRTAQVVPGN